MDILSYILLVQFDFSGHAVRHGRHTEPGTALCDRRHGDSGFISEVQAAISRAQEAAGVRSEESGAALKILVQNTVKSTIVR